ncbi:hypothetical protein [Lacrimispora indolis]|uniref:hypothetical protein n=1 Tax=Lacrimispora indolis TaxID=69825 RepID=UPI0012EBC54C|nr:MULTISPECIES: hypothetical protein [Lachnospiraceae]
MTEFRQNNVYLCNSHLVWSSHTIKYNYVKRYMIWDVLILGLVVVSAIIIATTVIITVTIDAVAAAAAILVQKQRERLIVQVSEMDAMILAAEATKDKCGC